MASLKLLTPAFCLLVLLSVVIPAHASEGLWRTSDSIPGYPPVRGVSLDPRPPRGMEWSWVGRAGNIETVTLMFFDEEWKGRKPIFNYYLVSECPDDVNEVYRKAVRDAIEKITHYRNKFVEMYPQFSYLLKLKLQLSDGPLDDNVFNIPIYTPKNCVVGVTSYATLFNKIELNFYGAAFHEIIHTLGSLELYYGSSPYYSFQTAWGWVSDIGDNTLSWYALALSWSWLRFYDVHPGLVREDFASKLQMNLKYKTVISDRETYFLIR